MQRLRGTCPLLLVTLWNACPAFSQAVNATILGSITDIAGGVVASARVTVTETQTGVSRTGQANESGNYTFPDLPPGLYAVTAEQSGFKKETRRDVDLVVNSTARVDLQLQPGSITET